MFLSKYGYFLHYITLRLPVRNPSKKSSTLVDPVLFVQIWDNNKFRQDSYIGQLALDLLSFDGIDAFAFVTVYI